MKTQAAIQSFITNRHAQNLSPLSIQWYEPKLTKFAQFCPVLPKHPGPIEQFQMALSVDKETKYNYFKALKTFYHFSSRRYCFADPMEQIAPPCRSKKIMPTLDPRQIMQLIDMASNLRDRTLVTLFADTGGRLAEIAGLRRCDIKDDSILVNGKTGERDIPISDETRRLLSALIATDSNSEYVFNSRLGKPLGRTAIYRIISMLMGKAGIQGPKLGAHRLRHAFGKCYVVAGGDIRSLQRIMGHANINTTQKYASLNLNDTITKHHKFTPLRAAHAAAQASFFDKDQAIKEAEAILANKETS